MRSAECRAVGQWETWARKRLFWEGQDQSSSDIYYYELFATEEPKRKTLQQKQMSLVKKPAKTFGFPNPPKLRSEQSSKCVRSNKKMK